MSEEPDLETLRPCCVSQWAWAPADRAAFAVGLPMTHSRWGAMPGTARF